MFELAVLCPAFYAEPAAAIAASRAGALGILDLQYSVPDAAVERLLDELARRGRGRWAVQVEDEPMLELVLATARERLDVIALTAVGPDQLTALAGRAHTAARVMCVVTSVDGAMAAAAAGADAVIAKGHEAGGFVGEEGALVLLQRLVRGIALPVWVQGGIGLHTIAAAWAGGAAGAVLEGQVLLARESPLREPERRAVAAMDGSETALVGAEARTPFRVYSRPGLVPVEELGARGRAISGEPSSGGWRAIARCAVADGSLEHGVLPVGQDGAFAADLARRFVTVAGILDGLQSALNEARAAIQQGHPLAEGAPLAESHRTRYPIVQGPMTRVSDRAEFAAAVADAGALPFIALALMRAPEADAVLRRCAQLLGDRTWGVGILGFVPPELRAEQLAVVRRHRPPFALIAGGRPDQALELERDGIATYLHVPSPALLKLYLDQGARRFVFEGRECGGHVGPRTSFVLWEAMLGVLESEVSSANAGDCHILFAGGIHDARSAGMVGALSARAAAHGMRVGVLLGTAYLFTHEATEQGAITPGFQRAAVAMCDTVLLESGPGHATRCLPSPFVEQFATEKRRLEEAGIGADERRGRLEQLNIGRLRIAAKGVDRNPHHGADPDAPRLVPVPEAEQWSRGMFMIGQVGVLRDETVAMAELHRDVSAGSGELLRALAAGTAAEAGPEPAAAPAAPPPADVAVVGLAAILPGAPDVATLWGNILGEIDAISEVPADRWDWRRMYDADPAAPDKVYSRWGGFIDAVPFDPMRFGLPPRSLDSIEPFQLLALVTAQNALRDAGYDERPFARERTSVILGAGGGGADLSVGYTVRSALPALLADDSLVRRVNALLPEWTEDSFPGLLMNVAAGRVANRLDLGGANFTVDAACASSLAAVALAVRELQAGTSDMVLAGGVDAIQNPFAYLCFSKTHALSPRGRCRPFDASADGIAISEGFATVVLKRLVDAERDGDRIYAVIKGVGAASDGRDRSLTAPRPEGQMRALRRAYAQARIPASTVGLVEAHGTGTVAGDGAEVEALSAVLEEAGADPQTCAIGSIKSMVGHTKATAGVAGLIKASLALHHRILPPTIGVSEPNPRLDGTPLFVNTVARPWLSRGAEHPRRAGVSAFGFGGTDFHVVLEEYADAPAGAAPAAALGSPEVLLWRGTRPDIARELATLSARLAQDDRPSLGALARSLAASASTIADGTSALALVVGSADELPARLEAARAAVNGREERVHRPDGVHWVARPLAPTGAVAFLFPGQGSQTVDMARELVVAFPEAREPFELADRALAGRHVHRLSRFVFPPPAFAAEDRRRLEAELTDTHVAQPALGAAELAWLRVLSALGIEPAMTAGHSYGELVALAAAGAMDAETLLVVSETRGRLMREASTGDAGAMAAVAAPAAALEPLLRGDDGIVAANLNGPEQTVLSGPREGIERAIEWCRERGITARSLPVACAFHSPFVAGARERFAAALADVDFDRLRLPVFANTTAAPYPDDPTQIARLLSDQVAHPVRFMDEVRAMHAAGARLFVEVGPKSVLTGLVGQILAGEEHVAVAVDQPGRALEQLVQCAAALMSEGVPVRLDRLLRSRDGGQPPAAADAPPDRVWLVDGGSVRRADQPRRRPEPVQPSPEERPMTPSPVPVPVPEVPAISAVNGHGRYVAPVSAPPPVSAERAAEVMAGYQQLMQHFLETQRDVMLGYLGGGRPARAARPAPAALPAAAPPAPVPAPAVNGAGPAAPAPVAITAQVVAPAPIAAPASAPPPGAPPPEPAAAVEWSRAQIEERLLAIVGDRTGYPTDMLSLDGDLEGDLGIDSIKRVEIAGTFIQMLAPEQRASIDMERLTAGRTLGEVVGVIEQSLAAPQAQLPAPPAAPAVAPFEPGPAETERIGRFVLQTLSAPMTAPPATPASPGAITVVVDDGSGAGAALAAALTARDREALLLPGPIELADEAEAGALVGELRRDRRVGALVYFAPAAAPDGGLRTLFLLTHALAADLTSAPEGAAVVMGVTRLGGDFGVGVQPPAAGSAAIAGFLKSLALEWPAVRVKAVDLPGGTGAEAAESLLAEFAATDGLVEVGYSDAGERLMLGLEPRPLSSRDAGLAIDAESVVLVTGGARGITAQVAQALADWYRPTLLLVGRTTEAEEPAETAALTDVADLRAALIDDRRRRGGSLIPALVERECRSILRAREVRENLARMRATGAAVEYLACDVRDDAALASLVEDVYARHGRIDGVIHGAGVIEDRLVVDKRLDSLQRVMATKAGAAWTLTRVLRPDSLRFLVLFSSVSGRFGNRGQADYAAASEVLNKIARDLDRRWPARVVSINWGPWRSTGMVSPALEREFARRGVALIEADEGCRLLRDELLRGRKGESEVILGAATGPAGGGPAAPPAGAGAFPLLAGPLERVGSELTLVRALALERDRYLDHHRVDDRPVLPFAVSMELMAEMAALASPGRTVAGLSDIRLLNGVTVPEAGAVEVALTAVPAGDGFDVVIAPRHGGRAHYRARVQLRDGVPPPTPTPPALTGLPPFPLPIERAYRELLFHGPLFQRIESIDGLDERGAVAWLRASAPAACVAGAAGRDWVLDPIMLDAALQVQVLWARLQWDVTLLPAEIGSHLRLGAPRVGELVRHEMRIRPESSQPLCRVDHWFHGEDGRPIAMLGDVVGVGTQALNRLATVGA